MNNSLQNLPPEMQQRISNLLSNAQQNSSAISSPAPIAKPPSLMDHTLALRQEVAQLSNQVAAMGQVIDAVGQAMGELYQLFQVQTATTDYSATYPTQQQQQQETELESDY